MIEKLWSDNSRIAIASGPHTIGAYGDFASGFFHNHQYARTNVSFTAKANENYILKMKGIGDQIQFWITNNEGEPASAIYTVPAEQERNATILGG